jgi:catechol 2,3-dioxygenase-like lactoylglutathione lyase family enzyme
MTSHPVGGQTISQISGGCDCDKASLLTLTIDFGENTMTEFRLSHVVLQTGQLAAMRDWYLAVLDARVVYENPVICLTTFDDEHHRLALLALPAEGLHERTPTTIGLSHSAFTFGSMKDLVARYRALRKADIVPWVPVQHGITTSLYYRDPDGNTVELQIDNFSSADEATQYMHGPEFHEDPVGPTFDAEALADAFDAGVPVTELMTREWAAKGPQVDALRLLMS